MISLSDDVLQIHHFGNKCLIKTDKGLAPQNEYVTYIINYVYRNATTIEDIAHSFIDRFKVLASFEDVEKLIRNYILSSEEFFKERDKFDEAAIPNPLISGVPNRYVPYLLNIELTNICNLNCSHCYKEANCHNPSELEFEKIERLLSFLDSRNMSITLTGGEPTFHRSFEDVVALCARFGRVDIVTNGIALKHVSETTLKKLNLIGISLYGTDNESYEINTGVKNGFSMLKESTEYLRSVGRDFVLTIVLDTEKIKNMEKYIDAAVELGAINLQIGLPIRSGKLAHKTPNNRQWALSAEEKRYAYKMIRKYQKEKSEIKILDWERDVYEKKRAYDDPNNPSNFYETRCMKCGAGTTQWSVSEDFRFRPCNLLSNTLPYEISFDTFMNYVDGKHIIDWKLYMKNCEKAHWEKYGFQLSECCKRLTDFCTE